MESIKIGKYEASVKARELEKLYKLEEIHHLLPALTEIAASRRVIVLVDELDRGWDSSEDARAFVAPLFQASISINSLHDNLRVYMWLDDCTPESLVEILWSTGFVRAPAASRFIPCSGPTSASGYGSRTR